MTELQDTKIKLGLICWRGAPEEMDGREVKGTLVAIVAHLQHIDVSGHLDVIRKDRFDIRWRMRGVDYSTPLVVLVVCSIMKI
jgi:hypothetical protein